MKIIMLGAPGASKGTQTKQIAEKYHIPRISTGDIFRANIKGGMGLGMKAGGFMDQGMLVSDEITIGMPTDRIKDADYANGYVLDGFLGTVPQVESLTKALSTQGESIDFTINMDIPDDNAVSRTAGRRTCLACGTAYHVEPSPPKKEGACDVCDRELMLRDDDKPEAVQERLDAYHEQAQPLVEYYKQAGVLAEMDGTQNMDDVFSNIVDILGAQYVSYD